MFLKHSKSNYFAFRFHERLCHFICMHFQPLTLDYDIASTSSFDDSHTDNGNKTAGNNENTNYIERHIHNNQNGEEVQRLTDSIDSLERQLQHTSEREKSCRVSKHILRWSDTVLYMKLLQTILRLN